MQTGMVFNQKYWPGAGDVDDCWVVSSIQAVNVVAPWLPLYAVPTFRKAAGNPDQPGPTGGSLLDTVQGVDGCYPAMRGMLRRMRGQSWTEFLTEARAHRPISVSILSSKLPTRLRFGFLGYHRVTIAVKGNGTWLFANPLAPRYSRWQVIKPDDIKDAVLDYGVAHAGQHGVWAVVFPTDQDMAPKYFAIGTDSTPFDQEYVDEITADLRDKITKAKDALA